MCETIRIRDIINSLIYEGVGCSFATNVRNGWFKPGAGKMAELIGSQLWKETDSTRSADQRDLHIQRAEVDGFITKLKRFKALLFMSIYIWSGQPGRGLEISILKHCDIEQQLRNVYIFDGQMLLITDRNKGRRGRKVARFLLEDLSKVMVAYIVWLILFERVLYKLSAIRGPSEDLAP
jgi:hypothetical protein